MGLTESKPQEVVSQYSNITRNDFPDDFVFGTATAAYQVEGSAAKGGRSMSVWDAFTLDNPGRIADGTNGNIAVDFYTRYKEDIKMMKNMGFDAFRMSISWPRILPGGRRCRGINQEGIDFYNDVINTLIANGLQPYVTIYHWDHPYILEQEYGGWLSEKMVEDFRDFAELCFWEFGDRVKHWITLNEPVSYVVHGYVGCLTPPGKMAAEPGYTPDPDSDGDILDYFNKPVAIPQLMEDILGVLTSEEYVKPTKGYNFVPFRGYQKVETLFDLVKYGAVNEQVKAKVAEKDHHFADNYITDLEKDAYIAARNMLLAHAEAYHSYKTKFQGRQNGKVGITLVTHWFEPYSDSEADKKAAERAFDFMLGWYLEPLVTGSYPQSMKDNVSPEILKPFSGQEVEKLKGSMDFLGLNYYTGFYAAAHKPDVLKGYNKDQNLKIYKKNIHGERIGDKSGTKWLHLVPWGFYNLIEQIDKKYNKDRKFPPIYITENGCADANDHEKTAVKACEDSIRIRYHQDHLGHLLKAMKCNTINVNVKGYFAWSYCDNFEWTEGYKTRFGMVYIDYMNNLKRYPKNSAVWFSHFLVRKKKEENLKLTHNAEPSSPGHADQRRNRFRRHLPHEKSLSATEA